MGVLAGDPKLQTLRLDINFLFNVPSSPNPERFAYEKRKAFVHYQLYQRFILQFYHAIIPKLHF